MFLDGSRVSKCLGPQSRHRASSYATPSNVQVVKGYLGCPQLFIAGERALLAHRSVAVVGSRIASDASLALAAAVARELVGLEVVVISGLAAGVDTAAHCAAIEAGGRTVAVIGTELGRACPRDSVLQEHLYREHLLVSPFAPGTITRPSHFPMRNRVMAVLALATVVVAAGEMSGTRHQVRECLARGRRVLVSRHLVRAVTWVRELHEAGHVVAWDDPRELRKLVQWSE